MADPLEMFGAVYGSDESRRRFKESDFACPFDPGFKNGLCDKDIRGANMPNQSGNCSIIDQKGTHIICPRRFYEDNYRILHEVRDFIWGDSPALVYQELKLKGPSVGYGFGSLDWLIIRKGSINDFIGVEFQSNATTGTGGVGRAIRDLLEGSPGRGYGVGANSLDTIKRFMTQFIFKGQLFDDWKMPYVAVIQDRLWKVMENKFRIRSRAVTKYGGETFMFFIYALERDGTAYSLRRIAVRSGRWIDFLFAYAVDTELLPLREDMERLIEAKAKKQPILTL